MRGNLKFQAEKFFEANYVCAGFAVEATLDEGEKGVRLARGQLLLQIDIETNPIKS